MAYGLNDSGILSPDLHVHTAYCGHARGMMEESVEHAVVLGLPGIGFTGHFPYPGGYVEPLPDAVIAHEDFPKFMEEASGLKEKYQDQIPVYIAAEIDYIPGFMNKTSAMLGSFSFDYIIGSVHLIRDIMIDHSEEMLNRYLDHLGGVEGVWLKYWDAVEALIYTDLCDVLAHLDLPKKFLKKWIDPSHDERMVQILNLIKEKNMVLEINSGGVDRTIENEPYPSDKILKIAAGMDIDIMLGSDAHCPGEVGRYFKKMVELIRSLGWSRVVFFEDREKKYLDIDI